jgi:hypothetical protein
LQNLAPSVCAAHRIAPEAAIVALKIHAPNLHPSVAPPTLVFKAAQRGGAVLWLNRAPTAN